MDSMMKRLSNWIALPLGTLVVRTSGTGRFDDVCIDPRDDPRRK
jgi:hypothetical protein